MEQEERSSEQKEQSRKDSRGTKKAKISAPVFSLGTKKKKRK